LKRDDHVQPFTSGLLALSGEAAVSAQAHFGQRFEFQELRKPGVVSLGGRGPAGDELGYSERAQENLQGVFSFAEAKDYAAALQSWVRA
jgi:hypothetical protein